MVEGGRQIGAAGLLYSHGGGPALAGSVSVGWWRSNSQLSPPRRQTSEFAGGCGGLAPPARRLVFVRSESQDRRRLGFCCGRSVSIPTLVRVAPLSVRPSRYAGDLP